MIILNTQLFMNNLMLFCHLIVLKLFALWVKSVIKLLVNLINCVHDTRLSSPPAHISISLQNYLSLSVIRYLMFLFFHAGMQSVVKSSARVEPTDQWSVQTLSPLKPISHYRKGGVFYVEGHMCTWGMTCQTLGLFWLEQSVETAWWAIHILKIIAKDAHSTIFPVIRLDQQANMTQNWEPPWFFLCKNNMSNTVFCEL